MTAFHLSSKSMNRTSVLGLLALGLLITAACSRDPKSLLETGRGYLAEGKYREAIIELRSAINADPRLADAHYELGIALASLGQMADAKIEFGRTVQLQP